jgi:predicted nucleic acid-binding protein
MGAVVLDAGVVIALLERQDVHHAAATRAIREARDRGEQLILPASVYAEVLVQPARRNEQAAADVDDAIDAIPAVIVPIERAIARSAGAIRAADGRSLTLPDAMVLACAQIIGADRVLSTDRVLARRGINVELVGGPA